MKLVASRIAHADTITDDDGNILGIIYFNIQPLDERLTIGSWAGNSGSLFTNDSPGPGASATMIFPPRHSNIEPRSNPHILDG